MGAGGLLRAGGGGGGDAAVGPGVEGAAPRREPARAVRVEPLHRRGVQARPDDARAVPDGGDRGGLLRAGGQRLHGEARLGSGGHCARGAAVLLPGQAGAYRRPAHVGDAGFLSHPALLQPVRAERRHHGCVGAGAGYLDVAVPGRGEAEVPVRRGGLSCAGVHDQGDGVPARGGAGHLPGGGGRGEELGGSHEGHNGGGGFPAGGPGGRRPQRRGRT